MAQLAEKEKTIEAVDATLNYFANLGEKPYTETAAPGSTDVRVGSTPDPRTLTIHNGRLHADEFALERNGFRFVRHDTQVKDFFDEEEVRRVYYPEMEALIKKESGASRVVVFRSEEHTF